MTSQESQVDWGLIGLFRSGRRPAWSIQQGDHNGVGLGQLCCGYLSNAVLCGSYRGGGSNSCHDDDWFQ